MQVFPEKVGRRLTHNCAHLTVSQLIQAVGDSSFVISEITAFEK